MLELVTGETLEERIACGPLTLDDALDVRRQIIEDRFLERGAWVRALRSVQDPASEVLRAASALRTQP